MIARDDQLGQYSSSGFAPARSPQVRWKISFSISMAMSQRTPSHWPAMISSRSDGRLTQPGVEGVELQDIGPGREEGVPAAGEHIAPGSEKAAGSRTASSVIPLDEVLRVVG